MAAAAGPSARKPIGEVIMEFADGGTYIKDRLEAAVADQERIRIGWEVKRRRAATERQKKEKDVKEEDVEYLIENLHLPRAQALSLLITSSASLDQCIKGISDGSISLGGRKTSKRGWGLKGKEAGQGVNGVEKGLEGLKV